MAWSTFVRWRFQARNRLLVAVIASYFITSLIVWFVVSSWTFKAQLDVFTLSLLFLSLVGLILITPIIAAMIIAKLEARPFHGTGTIDEDGFTSVSDRGEKLHSLWEHTIVLGTHPLAYLCRGALTGDFLVYREPLRAAGLEDEFRTRVGLDTSG